MDLPVIDTPAPVTLLRPTEQTVPLVFASGHSGHAYPAAFRAMSRLDARALRRSEDSFVDELFTAAPDHGAPLLRAEFPRAYCDPNRERWELDPAMFDGDLPGYVNTTSPRVGAGLGTIPRIVSTGEAIHRSKISFAEAEARVRSCWDPYHAALGSLVAATLARFGACLLVDCHSMPANGALARDGGSAGIVLGDAHGRSCAPGVTRQVEQVLVQQGYVVRRNDPYAGGYVTHHYGAPAAGVHVLQIEIARDLYMDEALIIRSSGFVRMQADMTALVADLAKSAPGLLGTT